MINLSFKHKKLDQKGFGNHILVPLIVMISVATIGGYVLIRSHAAGSAPRVGHPGDTGGQVCQGGANDQALHSPYSSLPAPFTGTTASVPVPSGDNSQFDWDPATKGVQAVPVANRTYWFASGIHTLGSGVYSQITPANNDVFVGATGAIIDGQNKNEFAFTQQASNVTIEYLTVRNFIAPEDQFVVNHDSGVSWTISHNTIGPNAKAGAGLGLGDNELVTYNCITQNGQYGINGYNAANSGGPLKNVTISHNQIDTNDVYTINSGPGGAGCPSCGYDNYPKPSLDVSQCPYPDDCGVSGGAKFWDDVNLTFDHNVVTNNHHTGIWADTSNQNIVFNDNYFAGNWGIAIWYEVSYNPTITNNTLVNNGIVDGARDKSKLDSAIYFSESGYDSRVDGGKGGTRSTTCGNCADVGGNTFKDNWSGVAMWENPNRYCSNGLPTTNCTLVSPQATFQSCAKSQNNGGLESNLPISYVQPGSAAWNCRWRTQNIYVHDSSFALNTASVNAFLVHLAAHGDAAALNYPMPTNKCTVSMGCGFNSTVSNYSSVPFWPEDLIPNAITFEQNLQYDNNTYTGPWQFDIQELGGTNLTFKQWQTAIGRTDKSSGKHGGDTLDHPAHDVHSTYKP